MFNIGHHGDFAVTDRAPGRDFLGSPEQQQVRAAIGRRLREHYEAAASQTIPDRLAQLIEQIEKSESGSEQLQPDHRKGVIQG
jgi:hypothetical protein